MSHQSSDHDDESGVDVDINVDDVVDKLSELVDVLSDFTGSFSEVLTDTLFQVFWQPFLTLLDAAVQFVVVLLSWMPPTTLPEILAVHRNVFLIAAGLASIGVVVTGLAFIGYGPAGLSYRRLRPVIPKLLAALVFGGLAPWLLAPIVDLSEAAALAFAPQNPDTTAMLMLGGELVVIGFVQSLVLLALLAVLGMTKIFVAFGVAAAPLIAVLWAVPWRYTQGKADALIGAWWAALLVGPFDMIVFRLTLGLLSFDGFDAASWILGLAGPLLMIGLPYLLFTSGITAAAPAMAAARGATQTVSNRVDPWHRDSTDIRQTNLTEFDAAGGGHTAGSTPSHRESANRFKTGNILSSGETDD